MPLELGMGLIMQAALMLHVHEQLGWPPSLRLATCPEQDD